MALSKIEKVSSVDLDGAVYTNAPNLFPRAEEYTSEIELRKYITACLTKLAEDKKLFITDIMNQRKNYGDIAGQVILGHQKTKDTKQPYVDTTLIPMELDSYTVKIRSLNKEPLKWKTGRVDSPFELRGSNPKDKTYKQMDQYARIADTEAELNIRHAWHCLRQSGKHCKRALSTRLQDWVWKCEEVLPVGLQQTKSKGK